MIYLSAKQISEQYAISVKSARTIIHEIRGQIESGRYPEMSILEGCGVRVNESVFVDYLHYRKPLKDAIARKYVRPYREEEKG